MTDGRILDLCCMSVEDTKYLNRLYSKYKKYYVEMIDRIGRRQSNIYWWITPLANKNWYLSESLKSICIAILGIERIQKYYNIEEVYCPSIEVAETIEKYCNKAKRQVRCKAKNDNKNITIKKQILCFEQCVRKELDTYKRVVRAINEYGFTDLKNKKIILIDTYIKASEVDKDGYEEKYFKNISDYTDEKIFFLPQIVLNTREPINVLIKKILKSKSYKYVFKEQFLEKSDYYKLFLYPLFCVIFCLRKKYIRGIDVTAIINKDLVRGITSGNSMEGMLKYFSIKGMKRQGINIDRLIGWYEGQASSNGLFLAYRRMYLKGKSIGYIGGAIDSNNINLAPSREQIRHKAIPQEITVIAECFKHIPKQFVSDVKVTVVPAFRLQKEYQYADDKKINKKRILVALSYDKRTSTEMLKWVKNLEDFCREEDITIHIKNHPCNIGLTLKQYGIQHLKCNYKFVDGEFSKAVREVNVVVTTQSNAGYETALYGIPIIFLNLPSELNINYMPKEWDLKRYKVVYSIEELRLAISKYIDIKLKEINLKNGQFHAIASTETVSHLFM